MPGRALFDRVVVVDWSAASAPKRGRDSIWVATIDEDGRTIENPATRHACEDRLRALLRAGSQERTLLGVDFSLGFPAGTATALGLSGDPWRSMWDLLASEIADDGRNRNNRFRVAADLNRRVGDGPGPFWGRPRKQVFDSLGMTKPVAPALPEWRVVERVLRAAGRRPFSSWQLLGAGCVGSQTLVGIPVIERLRRANPGRVHVWPFTTGLVAPMVGPGDVVVAEVWPSLIDIEAEVAGGDQPGPVRDAVQVEALALHLAGLDGRGELGADFAPGVDAEVAHAVVAEEGWVLGAAPGGVASEPAAIAS